MKTTFNSRHFLLMALLLAFGVLLVSQYLSTPLNKTYTDGAFAITTLGMGLVIYFFIKEINRATRLHVELHLREIHLQETLNSLEEGVIITDMRGIVDGMNAAAEQLTGWPVSDAIGKPLEEIYDVVNEETGSPFENIVKRILAKGQPIEFENNTVLRKKNALEIIISNNGSPLRDVAGNILGSILVFRDITAKKRAEEEVKKSRQYLQSILDQSMDVICTINNKGVFVMVSKACETLLDYKPYELIGKPYIDFVYDEDVEHTNLIATEILNGKQVTNFENRYKHKNGSLIPIIWSARWDKDSDLMYCVARDGTEKQKAQAKIIASENRFRKMIEKSADMITLIDANGKLLYVSPSLTSILGYTAEDYASRPAFEFIHPDDVSGMMEQIKDIMDNPGKSLYRQQRLLHKNGTYRWCEGNIVNLFNEPGINGIVSNFRDISARKAAESENIELFTRLQLATTSAGMGIWEWDLPKNQLTWDERMFKLYQVERGQFSTVYEAWLSRLHPHDKEITNNNIVMAIEGKKQYNTDFRIVVGDSDIRYLRATGIVERDESGKALRMIGANWDITQKKEVELALKKLNETLEKQVEERTAELMEANKDLEAYTGTVSHDLRAPARAINKFAEIIREEYGDRMEPKQKELFQHIEDSGQRMTAIIDDLLKLARFGNEQLKLEAVDMTRFVQGIWWNISRLEPHSAELDLQELGTIKVDLSMMQQVIVNLLSNAIKYSSKKAKPTVTVWSEHKAGNITFYFKDNGAGFDMKNYDRLFGAFQRFHNQRDFDGTGVGLTLVKRIIEKHGGTVGADAEVGEGATFYFALPLQSQ